jgi:hypothetical protein
MLINQLNGFTEELESNAAFEVFSRVSTVLLVVSGCLWTIMDYIPSICGSCSHFYPDVFSRFSCSPMITIIFGLCFNMMGPKNRATRPKTTRELADQAENLDVILRVSGSICFLHQFLGISGFP